MRNKKNKPQLNTTISPITMRRLEAMVETTENFSSKSDAVEKSIDMMYFTMYGLGVRAFGSGNVPAGVH